MFDGSHCSHDNMARRLFCFAAGFLLLPVVVFVLVLLLLLLLAAMRGGADMRPPSRSPQFAWFVSRPAFMPGLFAPASAACIPFAFFLRYSFGIGWGAPSATPSFLFWRIVVEPAMFPPRFLLVLARLPAGCPSMPSVLCLRSLRELEWFFGRFTCLLRLNLLISLQVLLMPSVDNASKSAAFLVRYHARVGQGLKVRANVGGMAGGVGACAAGREEGDGDGGSTEGAGGEGECVNGIYLTCV